MSHRARFGVRTSFRSIAVGLAFLAGAVWADTFAFTDVRNAGFELDGDIADLPGNSSVDWVNMNCTDPDGALPNVAIHTGAIHQIPDSSLYTQGSKDILDWPSNAWAEQGAPDKADIVNAYAAQYSIATGEKIVFVGGERLAQVGTTFIGAWFLQDVLCTCGLSGDSCPSALDHEFTSPGADGTCGTSDDTAASRKIGDVLILADFDRGGRVSTPKVFEWVGNRPDCCGTVGAGNCPAPLPPNGLGRPATALQKGDTLCDITPSASGVVLAQGVSNSASQTIPATCDDNIDANDNEIDPTLDFPIGAYDDWKYKAKAHNVALGIIPANGFFEVGLNFTALGLGGECFSSILLETRSSSDVDAELKDFLVHSFAPCRIECTKSIEPVAQCEGAGPISYQYSIINGPAGLTLTACDDNATPADGTDDFCITGKTASGTCTTVKPVNCASPPVACRKVFAGNEVLSCSLTAGGGTVNSVPAGSSRTNILTVRDISGQATDGTCTDTVTVFQNPVVVVAPLACNAPSGSFDLDTTFTTPGTPNYACEWKLNGTVVSTTTDQTDCDLTSQSAGGAYSCKATDANGCEASCSIDVGYCSP
jgi:hypothetical protein